MNQINSLLNDLSDLEKQQVLTMLEEINNGESNTYTSFINDIWDEIPVDIDTFFDDEKYMRNYLYPDGKNCIVYPYWRNKLKELYKNPYQYSEVAITGGIGLGKSEIAKIALCYLTYRLLCLKNPQLYYNKPFGKPIVVLFMNKTKELAEKVLLQPFVDMLQTSPWFNEHGRFIGREHIRYIPYKNVRFEGGSQSGHGLGQDIFASILDEVNFTGSQNVSVEKSQIMQTYTTINTRITNRFRVEGNVHGKIFMVSSKKADYSFLETYIDKMKDQPNFYLVDDKVWNIVPKEKTGYSGKMFNLAIGGDKLPSKIIKDDENIDDYIKQGYQIMEVPIEERQKFVINMEQSLMDIAAVSVASVTKFFTYDIIKQCYSEDENPFTQEILSIGIKDDLQIKDFFIANKIPNEIRKLPIFIHIDSSLTGDRTGIGATALLGKKKTNTFDINSNKTIQTYVTLFKHILNVEIECPKNSEISFQKTRNFIIYLKQIGFNIQGVSCDGYQSADTLQLLGNEEIEHVERLNFEKTPEIYLSFRNALIEQRISLLKLDNLEKEMLNTERDNKTDKITHPREDGSHGDGCDSCVGSYYLAFKYQDEYSNVLTNLNIITANDSDLDLENLRNAVLGIPNIKQSIQQEIQENLFNEVKDHSKQIQNQINNIQQPIQQEERKPKLSNWIL